MRRILTALFLLLLTLAAAAQDPRRAWLLTMEDFQANWPLHYRVEKAQENIDVQEFMGQGVYLYHYMDRKGPILVMSQLHKEASSLKAEFAYAAFKWASHSDGSKAVDYSAQVKAGQASQCKAFGNGHWFFACRQKRVWGFVMVSGLKLKAPEMSRIVRTYAKRLEALQAPKKRAKKGMWRF